MPRPRRTLRTLGSALALALALASVVVPAPASAEPTVLEGETQISFRQEVPGGRQVGPRTYDEHVTLADRTTIEATSDGRRLRLATTGLPPAEDANPFLGLTLVAPDGRPLEVGRVYEGRTDRTGRGPLHHDLSCGSVASTVRFVLPELRFADDGSLASFRLVARQWCDSGEAATSAVSWHAAEPTAPFSPAPRVSTRLLRARGATREVDVAVQVPLGHGVTDAALHAVTRDGRRRLVAAGPIDPVDGSMEVTTTIAERTTFVATVVDDVGRPASGSTSVTRLRDFGLLLVGPFPVDLPRVLRVPVGARPRVSAFLAPSRAGDCVRLEVQQRSRDRWAHR